MAVYKVFTQTAHATYTPFLETLVETGYLSLPRAAREALNIDEHNETTHSWAAFSIRRLSLALCVETRLHPSEAADRPTSA